jgi:hypothetical protein
VVGETPEEAAYSKRRAVSIPNKQMRAG